MKLPEFSKYFSDQAGDSLSRVLQLALDEDGPDLTSDSIFSPEDRARATIVAKEKAVVAGFPVIPLVMERCGAEPGHYSWEALVSEGEEVEAGTILARLNGPTRQILRAERVILNVVSHLSGIATLTRRYVDAIRGTGVRLLDTRKTLPGLRYPDKYAVLCGGGENHRRNLAEMIMVKDNHIDAAGSISAAVEAVRRHCRPCPPIEVECRNPDEVREAVACGVDRIMLDNMGPDALAAALPLVPASIETEVSGGVALENIGTLIGSGPRRPDFISVGRITHSAPSADFSMRIARESA